MLRILKTVFFGNRSATELPLPKTIRILFLVRLINSMGNFVFPFLTMLLTMKLGYTKTEAGTFMSTSALLAGLSILVGGKIGDSFGHKRTIVSLQLSAAVLLGTCAVLGLVPVVPFFVALAYVLLQASWPVFNALVADIAPRESRKRAYALLYWGNNIGFSIGPIMAGYLFNTHASLMFVGNAVSLSIVSMLLIFAVREQETAPAAGMVAAGPTAASACDDDEAPEDCSLVQSLLKRPLLIAFAFANLLLHFVYHQHLFGLPVFLNDTLGSAGPRVYGFVMTTNGLTVVSMTGLLTLLIARFRSGLNMALAALLYAIGFGMLSFCFTPVTILVSTFIWTLGEIISATNAQVFIATHTPSSHRGRINSVMSFISGWGSTLSPILSGAYTDRFGSRALWPLVMSTSLLAGTCMLFIARWDLRRKPMAQVR
ncbi:MFS transporter [Treponema sp.]